MFFNFRYPVVLFLMSWVGMLFGLGVKIMHWPGFRLIMGSMVMVQAISIIWLIIILIKSPKG